MVLPHPEDDFLFSIEHGVVSNVMGCVCETGKVWHMQPLSPTRSLTSGPTNACKLQQLFRSFDSLSYIEIATPNKLFD